MQLLPQCEESKNLGLLEIAGLPSGGPQEIGCLPYVVRLLRM